jgi:hypothetical protein|tara:strand:+ start:1517 stop:2557 length:1041 start_codon:yes stop_codon:yes gene_type:complete
MSKGTIPTKQSNVGGIPVTDLSSAQAAILASQKPKEETSNEVEVQTEVEDNTSEQVMENTESVEQIEDTPQMETNEALLNDNLVEDVQTETQEEQPTYTVNLDGNESEVTLDELKRGYYRHADYTKKTMSLSDEKKELNSELDKTRLERQNYLNALETYNSQTNGELKELERTNWTDLEINDRDTFLQKKGRYLELKENQTKAELEKKELLEKTTLENQTKMKELIKENQSILARELPIINDPQKGPTIKRAIKTFGLNQGFSQQEMDNIFDAKSVLVLYKAMQFDNLQNTKISNKKSKNVPKVTKPGTGVTRGDISSEKVMKQKARLRRTGKLDDAAALIKATMS